MLRIETVKEGISTLIKDEKYLLSRYQPLRDIERLIPPDCSGKAYVLFSDILSGLHPLLEKQGVSSSDIFIHEPADLRALGYPVSPPHSLESFLEGILLKGLRPEVLALPSFMKAWPEEYQAFMDHYTRSFKAALENLKVSSYFSKVWFLNYCRNLAVAEQKQGTLLKGNTAGTHTFPIVVCAAGPSLHRHIQTLKAHRDKFFLLSVLSAAGSLQSMGLTPDAVLISDAGVSNILHGEGLDPAVPVLAHIYASSALLSRIPNPVLFYNAPQELEQPRFSLDQPSVSIDAGLTAKSISGGPLIFCGLDLSYPLSGLDHSPGYAFSHRARYRQSRLRTSDSTASAYMGRKDLVIEPEYMTQSHFLMIKSVAEHFFEDCLYLNGGVEFQGLKKIYDLSILSGLPKISNSAIIRELKGESITGISYPSAQELLDVEELEAKIFTREILQKEPLNTIKKYYLKKTEKLKRLPIQEES